MIKPIFMAAAVLLGACDSDSRQHNWLANISCDSNGVTHKWKNISPFFSKFTSRPNYSVYAHVIVIRDEAGRTSFPRQTCVIRYVNQ